MADEVESMTDAQIRTRLSEFGMPVVPVTASTRNTLQKKLKRLISDKTSNTKRMSLAKYSSGEESSGDDKKSSRRYTVGGAMLPPTSSTKKLPRSKIVKPTIDFRTNDEPTQTRRTGRAKGSIPSLVREDDTNDSQPKLIRTYTSTTTEKTTRTYTDLSDTDEELPQLRPISSLIKQTPSPVKVTSSSLGFALRNPENNTSFHNSSIQEGKSNSSFLNRTNPFTGSRENSFESHKDYLPSTDNDYSTHSNITLSSGTTLEPFETPFLSEFTRRLEDTKRTSLGPVSPPTGLYNSKLLSEPVIHYEPQNATNNSYVLGRTNNIRHFIPPPPPPRRLSADNLFKKSNVIPLALVGILATFFVIVAVMYVGIKARPTTAWFLLENTDNVYPICQKAVASGSTELYQGPRPHPGINCVPEEHLKSALHLGKYLLPEIERRAVAYHCTESVTAVKSPVLTLSDVVDFVHKDNPALELDQISSDLDNLHVLVTKNPQWGLSVVRADGSLVTDLADTVTYQSLGLTLLKPDLPWLCILSNSIVAIIYTVAFLIIGGFAIYVVQYAIQYSINQHEEKNRKVFAMVESVIEILMQEASPGIDDNGPSPFIAVNDVRDRLIQPEDRRTMSKIWDETVAFLEQNESRIRSEIQNINGENMQVWRWVAYGSRKSNPSANQNRTKVWQGQAFETQKGSVNNLPISPTPCLKIRHMIDKNDIQPNLKLIIQDAILEKCGGDCNILHIQVDEQFYCVYVKCASQKDAGTAYRSLHGWWYDGKLVTVKYVRLERYLERFPNSAAVGAPLKPSNDKKLSLQCYKPEDNDN